MIANIIAALIGRSIDRADGKGGMKGALIGLFAAGFLRRLGPIGLLLGGAYAAKKALGRRKDR